MSILRLIEFHVISKLHDGQSCKIETTYQPILAVTDPVTKKQNWVRLDLSQIQEFFNIFLNITRLGMCGPCDAIKFYWEPPKN